MVAGYLFDWKRTSDWTSCSCDVRCSVSQALSPYVLYLCMCRHGDARHRECKFIHKTKPISSLWGCRTSIDLFPKEYPHPPTFTSPLSHSLHPPPLPPPPADLQSVSICLSLWFERKITNRKMVWRRHGLAWQTINKKTMTILLCKTQSHGHSK